MIGLLVGNAFATAEITATARDNAQPRFRVGKSSDRDLLGLGPVNSRLSGARVALQNASAKSDTLRILAIRVDFQEDDNSLTTGNGKFDLTSGGETFIDPAPHNLSYFEDQLRALSNYYGSVSRGQLILEGEVYPREPDASYTVSQEMSSYVPPNDETLLDQRLAEFFQESFQAADAVDNIDFSRYDVFMIFHAGVGADFSFDFDPTPQDVPSVFLDFGTLSENLGGNDPGYQGVELSNGVFIRDGIILPETQTQEGFELALLGTMAIMFGNQLGLPILFNPDTGRSGIGVFGLMDQGSGNFFGLLPAQPSAWSKVFLGWEVPIEVTEGVDLEIAAALAQNDNKLYKIPINTNEYFLLENRDRDINNDSLAVGATGSGARVEFRWDRNGQQVTFEERGVVTETNEYDFGVPGSGILIWHVDENTIAANFADNRVNADPFNRGVDLEEADGAQDIGQIYGFLDPGAGAENGVVEDMFWGQNEINMLVNDSSDVVVFSPTTRPNSNSKSGANSHIAIFDFSARDSVMTFSVGNDIVQTGFPQYAGPQTDMENSTLLADLDGDGVRETIAASSTSMQLFVWRADGGKLIPNNETAQLPLVNGESRSVSAAVFAELPGQRLFSPASVRLGQETLVIAASNTTVAAYRGTDQDGNGLADPIFTAASSSELTTSPLVLTDLVSRDFQVVVGTIDGDLVLVDSGGLLSRLANALGGQISGTALLPGNRIVFATRDGVVGVVDLSGSVLWSRNAGHSISVSPVIADLNQDGVLEVTVVTELGTAFSVAHDGTDSTTFVSESGFSNPSRLAVGDIDGDQFLDVVFVSANKLYVLNHTGFVKDGFPVAVSRDNPGTLSSPVLVDLNGDNLADIAVGTGQNQVVAFDGNGEPVAGFPLSTGGAVHATPFATDIDGDGDVELSVVSEDDFVYVWDLQIPFNRAASPWVGFLGDEGHGNANLASGQVQPGGGALMPSNLVYNYPNPTEGTQTTIRYTLNTSAQVRIKIYDLAGDFVQELSGTGFGQTENEVDWRLDDVESGVYLARVEASSGSQTEVAIIKVAVVK